MSQIVKLEKRFENALDKLELALTNRDVSYVSDGVKKSSVMMEDHHKIDELLLKIERLEEAAKKDALEIDRLVGKLKEILEIEND